MITVLSNTDQETAQTHSHQNAQNLTSNLHQEHKYTRRN